jgi:carboxyl-terminal processing protease
MSSRIRTFAWSSLTAVALLACSGTTAPQDTSPTGLFDAVWADFDRNYAFFDYGKIDWNALRVAYRDSVAASSEAEAARLIGAMIGRLNDYHADLHTPYGTFGAPPIPYAHHFSPAVVRQQYVVDAIRTTPSQRIAYAHLRSGIGYIHVTSFVGTDWGGEIETALAALADVQAMVLDIRDNGGGNEDMGREVAGRFYDMTRTYRRTQFRDGPGHSDFTAVVTTDLSPRGSRKFTGRVALVTNRFNGSSAEDFVLMMRALPKVTTVGDTTLGLGSNPLERTLANGWTYRVPHSMQSTPDGFVYQWKGLPPAVPVNWDAGASGTDPYLDAAIALLK